MADLSGFKIPPNTVPWYVSFHNFVDTLQVYCTEIENGRGTYPSLSAAISAKLDINGGLNTNLIANNHRLTGVGDPIDSQDAATKAYVNAVVTAGGSPSSIPITSLNYGTIPTGQYVRRVGDAIVGSTVKVSELDVTGMTDGQALKVSGGAVVGYTPPTYWQQQRLYDWRD